MAWICCHVLRKYPVNGSRGKMEWEVISRLQPCLLLIPLTLDLEYLNQSDLLFFFFFFSSRFFFFFFSFQERAPVSVRYNTKVLVLALLALALARCICTCTHLISTATEGSGAVKSHWLFSFFLSSLSLYFVLLPCLLFFCILKLK